MELNNPTHRLTDSSTYQIVRLISKDLELLIKQVLKNRKLEKSLYLYTTEILHNRLDHLRYVFPAKSLHAVAIKSNSHPEVLKKIVEYGEGLEAASIEEVKLAKEAGCFNDKIVFDSPVKTINEIEFCNSNLQGITLNANCFEELDRLKGKSNIRVGIRINPLMDLDNPGIYDVSSNNSKFGIPITEKERIIEYALEMENCKGLHIHAGSEIGSRENHSKAIASIVEVAEEIRRRGKKLDFIDIGGGVPARMLPGQQEGLDEFYKLIVDLAPEIEDYQIITEYGRYVQAHTAFVISKVEYVLEHTNPYIALIHVGADLFPREIYSSHPPHHEIYIFNEKGGIKNGSKQLYDIGGPLCFSGDFVKRGIELPEIVSGDIICITDTGANTLSMWSRHCSREEVELVLL